MDTLVGWHMEQSCKLYLCSVRALLLYKTFLQLDLEMYKINLGGENVQNLFHVLHMYCELLQRWELDKYLFHVELPT